MLQPNAWAELNAHIFIGDVHILHSSATIYMGWSGSLGAIVRKSQNHAILSINK